MRQSLLTLDAEVIAVNLNQRSFMIAHRLVGHDLFSLPRLVELAHQLSPSDVEYNAGNIPVGIDGLQTPHNGLSVEQTIRRIETCDSWLVLKNVESDPRYRAILDECLDEVQCFSEQVAPGMKRRHGFIFVSSPNAVTPFHFDQEYNFLLQLCGKKTVHVFPRQVITEREIEERFATTHRNLDYRDHYQHHAKSFELNPGDGLHVPIAAPHWVKNGESVSISFSITFQTPASEQSAALYRVNAHLRSLGMTPTPVGRSTVRDFMKLYGFVATKQALQPLIRQR